MCCQKHISEHVKAMGFFFSIYIILSVSAFNFISYFIAKSLSILQVIINSFICIIKNYVSGTNSIVFLLLLIFKNRNLFLMHN